MERRALVLDANILIRAVLGKRVRGILEAHASSLSFFVPESALAEAEEHLAALVVKRGGEPAKAIVSLKATAALCTVVGRELYGNFEDEARKRLGSRDPDGWPILAAALAFGCPIWTEDTDFFGCGVAAWTSSASTSPRAVVRGLSSRSARRNRSHFRALRGRPEPLPLANTPLGRQARLHRNASPQKTCAEKTKPTAQQPRSPRCVPPLGAYHRQSPAAATAPSQG